MLRGIQPLVDKNPEKKKGNFQIQEKQLQGSFNYFLYETMIYDLESNIPYITSPFKSENAYFDDFFNERNVFWDSTRNLCLDFPHMLIFSYSEREMDHWADIC